MLQPFKDFFTEGVFPQVRTLTNSRLYRASLSGTGAMFVPGGEALTIFRVLAHESAHGLEGLQNGAQVKKIDIEYKSMYITGTTELDNTTPDSAMRASLAGIGCDIGFILMSSMLLNKISPAHAILLAIYDLGSFFTGDDYKVYKIARKYREKEAL